MVIGMIFTKQILMLSDASGEILELAVRYLRIIFAGSLFVNFAQSSNMIMRGEGLLKQAMFFSAGSAIMNIILDPIFILLLKRYGMGIDGAAYATLVSQIAYAMASLWYFKIKSKNVRINAIRIEKTLFSEIIGVGFSAMLMQVMMLVQQTALYNLAAQHGGDTWQIILGATYRVVSFAFIPLWGLSQGYQLAVGTNYGAKQYDRVKHITKVFAITATFLALIFYLPIMLVPKKILSMFKHCITAHVFHICFVGSLDCGSDSDAVPWQSYKSERSSYLTPDSHLHTCRHHHAPYCWIWCTWRICCSAYY